MRTASTSFKPQLECLEEREAPSGLEAPVLAAPAIQQGAPAMQQMVAPLNTAGCPFVQTERIAISSGPNSPNAPLFSPASNPVTTVNALSAATVPNAPLISPAFSPLVDHGLTDLTTLAVDLQSIRALSAPVTSEAQALNQAVFMALGDANHGLTTVDAYLQVNGSQYGAATLGQAQCPLSPAH
ncbi:MAG TPA: hypothetical protein VH682_14230 [Gemmataceae bacterium]|jgi:hypothetical protein